MLVTWECCELFVLLVNMRNWTCSQYNIQIQPTHLLGLVHKYTGAFENVTFSMHFGLSSTRKKWAFAKLLPTSFF